jgi:hypothetical protein
MCAAKISYSEVTCFHSTEKNWGREKCNKNCGDDSFLLSLRNTLGEI